MSGIELIPAGAAVILFVAAFVPAWRLTGWLVGYLRRAAVMDMPGDRSSHVIPTPRGGGLAVIAVGLPAWWLAGWLYGPPVGAPGAVWWWAPPLGALGLAAISWIDDRRGLGPGPRFAVQIVAVAVGLALFPADVPILSDGLPGWLDRLLAGLGWLWFVNLYNFMDGIDGLAGSETMHVALGAGLLATVALGLPWLGLAGVGLAAAAAGFLMLNWSPAKLFMGDVGSIPLGYLLGFMLAALAAGGHLAAALILPAYYLTDATWTLLRRAARGEKIWQAHRQHFYQRAARGVGAHAPVARAVVLANLALLGLAAFSVSQPWPALAGAALVVAALLVRLRRMAGDAA